MNTQQIKYFFKSDYPKLSLLATGRCLSESSVKPVNIITAKKGSYGYYQKVFNLTNITIAKLENTAVHPYRTIIIERYVKHTRLKDVALLIGYSSNTTRIKTNEALLCFVNEYNKQADRYNLEFRFQ